MHATFMQRFLAYLIDGLIVSAVLFIFSVFLTSEKYQELSKEEEEVITLLAEEKIEIEEYIEKVEDIEYHIDKESFNTTLVGLVLNVGYFIVFQYLNKGQTVGKRIMKIKIIKQNGKLEAKDIVVRALIVNSILSTIVILVAVLFMNKELYFTTKTIISALESLFILISAMMILYRKDKLGLQDMITKTEVISERD